MMKVANEFCYMNRVWCRLLGLTTSHGAKDSTVWPLVPLLTTNKVLVSPNGTFVFSDYTETWLHFMPYWK